MTSTSTTRAGFVAILGAPNAGKSTLLNQMVGEKLSIVTRKAQTTRIRVLGLLTEGDAQIGLAAGKAIAGRRPRDLRRGRRFHGRAPAQGIDGQIAHAVGDEEHEFAGQGGRGRCGRGSGHEGRCLRRPERNFLEKVSLWTLFKNF